MNISKKLALSVLAVCILFGCFAVPAFSKRETGNWVLHSSSDPLTMNYYIRIDKIKDGMFVTFSEVLEPGPNLVLVSETDAGSARTLTINSGWMVNCTNGFVMLPASSEQHFRDGRVIKSKPRQGKGGWYKDVHLAHDICTRTGLKMRFKPPTSIDAH